MDSEKEVLHGQREASDLPGMMLVASPFDEPATYRAASAFEQAGDWQGVRP